MIEMILINGLIMGGMYAILAMGFSLVFGVGRILNIAHTAFYMVTAFLIFISTNILRFPMLPSAIVSVFLVMGLGMVCFWLFFDRVKEHETALIIIGISLALLFQEILLLIFGGSYRGIKPFVDGLVLVGDASFTYQQVLAIVASVITLTGVWIILKKTSLGLAIRSISQDREVANLMGIQVDRICLITFGISAGLAAIAGVVVAPIFMVHPLMWANPLIIILAATVLGGMGSIKGSVIASFILGYAETIVVFMVPEGSFLRGAVSMAIMISTLLIRPEGLFGVIFEEELL